MPVLSNRNHFVRLGMRADATLLINDGTCATAIYHRTSM